MTGRDAVLLALALGLAACATPAAPSGGPVDQTPPALVAATPADGATRVSDRTLVLTFSERLDPAAAAAVRVTPADETPPEVSVDARELRVTLPALRDSTTYVVTVGTTLKDRNGVALRAPLTLAFATGDAIDRGRITGRVRSPATGGPVSAEVWAYVLPDSTARPALERAPDYRTETAADGSFALEYLRQASYAVVAVRDRNRNGRIDGDEPVGVAPRPALRADTTRREPETWWLTARDSAPPRPLRVRPLSDRRLAVRFDRPVRLADVSPAGWSLADSASGRATAVRLYQAPEAPTEVVLLAETPLPATRHRLTYQPRMPPALTDSAGRSPEAFTLSVVPPARPDTAGVRFLGFTPGEASDTLTTLRPGRLPALRFSAPPGPLLDGVRWRGEGVPPQVGLVTSDGVTFRPDTVWAGAFSVSVSAPDSVYTRRFRVPTDRETGAIVGRVQADAAVWVEARPTDAQGEDVRVRAAPDGSFSLSGLLPGTYRIRLWVDRDGDGQWSPGTLAPYRAPEPLVLPDDPVQVRARWETELDPISP